MWLRNDSIYRKSGLRALVSQDNVLDIICCDSLLHIKGKDGPHLCGGVGVGVAYRQEEKEWGLKSLEGEVASAETQLVTWKHKQESLDISPKFLSF